jgi:threonine aldolase
MSDFRSDTVTRPTPAMRRAMAEAPVGDDVMQDDPSVNALQATGASRLGFEDALFMPSGTQANLVGIMGHCGRGDEAIVGQNWHTYRWEAGGMAVLGSIQPQPLPHQPDGTLALDDIRAAIKPDDPHHARTRLVVMENTHGGRVLPLAYLQSVRALALQEGLATHLDGARLFNAAVAEAGSVAVWEAARAICACFDSVSVCLSKGLGAPVGSLLLGTREFIARARRTRKLLGGGMRQAGILAAAGLYALEHHVERLADDHVLAAALADALAAAAAANPALSGHFTVGEANTNILFTGIPAALCDPLLAHLDQRGVLCTASRQGAMARMRWVTHLDVGPQDVQRAAAALVAFRNAATR